MPGCRHARKAAYVLAAAASALLWQADSFHPADDGYRRMAEDVQAKLS